MQISQNDSRLHHLKLMHALREMIVTFRIKRHAEGRGLWDTREMSSILRDKSPALPSTACPWSFHCSGPHTRSESVTHCPWGVHTHTGMQKHITAAALITHTITVRPEWLPRERECKRKDSKRGFRFAWELWHILLHLFSQDRDDLRLILLVICLYSIIRAYTQQVICSYCKVSNRRQLSLIYRLLNTFWLLGQAWHNTLTDCTFKCSRNRPVPKSFACYCDDYMVILWPLLPAQPSEDGVSLFECLLLRAFFFPFLHWSCGLAFPIETLNVLLECTNKLVSTWN